MTKPRKKSTKNSRNLTKYELAEKAYRHGLLAGRWGSLSEDEYKELIKLNKEMEKVYESRSSL
jgi:hypothetical protein